MSDDVSITNFGLSKHNEPTWFVHVNLERECPSKEYADRLVELHKAVIDKLAESFPVYVRTAPRAATQQFFDKSPRIYFFARYSIGEADYAPAGKQLSY